MAINEDSGWFGNLKKTTNQWSDEVNEKYGSKPGQAGRTASYLKNSADRAGELIGQGIDKGVLGIGKYLNENIQAYDEAQAETERNKQLAKGFSPEFDKFNAGFVSRQFPEISKQFGTAPIQVELAKNQVQAVEDTMAEAGLAFNDLRDAGLTRSQVWDKVTKSTQDPKELELAKQRLDEVYGPEDDGSFVKKTKQQQDVEDNVRAATNGADPTNSEVPEGVLEKFELDQGSILAQAADQTADTLHANHITPQNWYESRSFNMGLMRFGLGLLSGEDYATAFSNAAQDYTRLSDREKREAYADELISSGYDKASVMQWIDEGKANVLTKPKAEEKWVYKSDETGKYMESTTTQQRQYRPEEKPDPTQVIQTDTGSELINSRTGQTIRSWKGLDKKAVEGQLAMVENGRNLYKSATAQLDVLASISKEDIENAAGWSSLGGAWTDKTRSSVGKFNQLIATGFLDNVEKMKGMGALSNAEGARVSAAYTNMIDPDTGKLRTGLNEAQVGRELQRLKQAAVNSIAISRFYEQHEREPTIEEFARITNRTVKATGTNKSTGRKIVLFSDGEQLEI